MLGYILITIGMLLCLGNITMDKYRRESEGYLTIFGGPSELSDKEGKSAIKKVVMRKYTKLTLVLGVILIIVGIIMILI